MARLRDLVDDGAAEAHSLDSPRSSAQHWRGFCKAWSIATSAPTAREQLVGLRQARRALAERAGLLQPMEQYVATKLCEEIARLELAEASAMREKLRSQALRYGDAIAEVKGLAPRS